MLENNYLIRKKSHEDGRTFNLVLTKSVELVVSKLDPAEKTLLAHMTKGITEKQLVEFRQTATNMIENLSTETLEQWYPIKIN